MAPINPSSACTATDSIGHATNGVHPSINSNKPIVLHLGDPISYNHLLYSRLHSNFDFVRLDPGELHRPEFIKHLKDKTWGDFSAIMRPFWNTGGEMGRWDRELIDLLPKSMKVMASAGAGFDWIDTDLLGERGIIYTNGAGASTESVADMALFLIISVFRQMTWSSLAARSKSPTDFQKAHQKSMYTSHNPRNHSLGIVGLGNIGLAIAKKVRAGLGMRILYHDVEQKPATQEDEVAATFYNSLDQMLQASDCVLLASPHGPPILTARTLSLLRPGSRVVNIARGSLIDEDALADALESGHVSAAGLDVHAHEPSPSARLSDRRDVTLTCHTGGASVETIVAFERLALENVEAVLMGREPLTAVNLRALRTEGSVNGANGHAAESSNGIDGHDGLVNGHDNFAESRH